MTVHSILPDALTRAAGAKLDAAGIRHVAHETERRGGGGGRGSAGARAARAAPVGRRGRGGGGLGAGRAGVAGARGHLGGRDPALVFDDPTEEVSGHWVPHRPPSEPGLLFYLWVDDVASAIERVVAEGCELVQPIGGEPGELTARFRDPGGNVVGLYQEPR